MAFYSACHKSDAGFRSCISPWNPSSALCRFSMMSDANSSGAGRLSRTAKVGAHKQGGPRVSKPPRPGRNTTGRTNRLKVRKQRWRIRVDEWDTAAAKAQEVLALIEKGKFPMKKCGADSRSYERMPILCLRPQNIRREASSAKRMRKPLFAICQMVIDWPLYDS